jgi:hypothetical protein
VGDIMEGKDSADKNQPKSCSRAKIGEDEKGRAEVNGRLSSLIFGKKFHLQFESLEM